MITFRTNLGSKPFFFSGDDKSYITQTSDDWFWMGIIFMHYVIGDAIVLEYKPD